MTQNGESWAQDVESWAQDVESATQDVEGLPRVYNLGTFILRLYALAVLSNLKYPSGCPESIKAGERWVIIFSKCWISESGADCYPRLLR